MTGGGRLTAEENAERDEDLLHAGGVAHRVAVLDGPAVSIGVAVDPTAEFVRRARTNGLRVVRRSTGGTGVLLGAGDIAWSVVLPRKDARIGPGLTSAYARLGAPLVDVLALRGVRMAWSSAPVLSPCCCLLGGRGRVLASELGIVSGAAQHLTRSSILHHGTLACRVDRTLHRAVFPAQDVSVFDRLVGTQDLGILDEPEALRDELARAIGDLLLEVGGG